jgi:hypothetical protein
MNKIGLHIISGTSVPLGKPRLVKLVDVSPEYVRDVRKLVGPSCLIIVRWVTTNQNLDQPLTKARLWYATHAGQMAAMNDPNVAFESFNEIADTNASSYAQFEAERLRIMHSSGYRCVVGNWSVGVPKETMWPTYKPMLDAMGPGDLVGMHAYWSDRADIANPWHTARWTLPEVKPYLVGKQIVVTECGRDVVEGKGKPGWQLSCSADEFLGDLVECNGVWEASPNVVGGVVYQIGSTDDQWKPFDATPIWPRVVASYSVPQSYPAVTPPVIPPVTPPQPGTGTQANPIKEPPFSIDGRCMTIEQFEAHVKALKWPNGKPTQVYLHHTWKPTVADWQGKPTVLGMKAYYERQLWQDSKGKWHEGWSAGPHLFIAPDGIWLFTPLNEDGVHAAGHNHRTIGIEMVGDYDLIPPMGNILTQSIAAMGVLFTALGLNPMGLMFHRDVSTKTCPGTAVKKTWVIELVQSWINEQQQPPRQGLPEDETAKDAPTLAVKCRWWLEEYIRQNETGGDRFYAQEILYSLVKLFYRLENALRVGP